MGPGAGTATTMMTKDFSYLLRPEIYHQLSALTVPAAFRESSHQPAPDTTIDELLAGGHFRAAAIAAVQALTSATAPVDPTDHARIFKLLYTRLACLCLADATSLAAQEAKALEDLNSAFYVDAETSAHLVPWDLRVLAVRLQTIGFGDPRRAVMSYYELAREARAAVARAARGPDPDRAAARLWDTRLADLGVRVAGALIEMDDLAGAAEHLSTLGAGSGADADGGLAMSRALMWLHLGDVEAARRCIGGDAGSRHAKVVEALADMADGDYEAALRKWRALQTVMEEGGEEAEGTKIHDEMVGVNLAVCLLYVGRMEEVSFSFLYLPKSIRPCLPECPAWLMTRLLSRGEISWKGL